MKRICIISDIHSNLHALNKFLEYIDSKYDIEYILNLGDFLKKGPNPSEVFDIVMNDKRFINIMGNSEYELIHKDFKSEFWSDRDIEHENWTLHELGEDRINKLKKLPLSKTMEVYGKKLFMMHGNFELDTEWPFEYGFWGILRKAPLDTMSENDMTLTINDQDYLLVALNHTQGIEKQDEYSFIQPGAIGCLDTGDIKFAVLEVDENEENIIFKTLKYDSYKVIEECLEKEVPDSAERIYKNKVPKDYYTVGLSNKYATFGKNCIPMDFSFWKPLVKPYLEKYKYVEFSLWDWEKELLDELKNQLKIVNVKESENSEQIFVIAEIDEKLKEYLTKDYLNSKGLIKWFDVSIYNEKEKCDVCIYHNGCEIYLHNIKKEETEFFKSIINPQKVRMQLN